MCKSHSFKKMIGFIISILWFRCPKPSISLAFSNKKKTKFAFTLSQKIFNIYFPPKYTTISLQLTSSCWDFYSSSYSDCLGSESCETRFWLMSECSSLLWPCLSLEYITDDFCNFYEELFTEGDYCSPFSFPFLSSGTGKAYSASSA